MRWFFFILVLANVGFYYWRHMESSPPLAGLVEAVADSGESLLLLSESPTSLGRADSHLSPDEPQASAGQETCWARGPYRRVEPPRGLAAQSPLFQLKAEVAGEIVEYWVHLGPYASRAEASQQNERLKKKSVDSFVIRDGELENAVSLGVFSEASRAETLLERLRKRGYNAEIRRLSRHRYQYWVSLRGAAADEAVEDARRQLFNKQNDGSAPEKKSCNVVASWNDFN